MLARRVWFLMCWLAMAAQAAPSAAEQARIDRLLGAVEARTELRFVRNEQAHSSAEAARFLREKLKSRNDGVLTAEDFIDRIASRSSTSGLPYRIRWPNGREQPAAEVLHGELNRMATPGP